MNKTVLAILIIFIVVAAGVYAVFYRPQSSAQPASGVAGAMSALKKETGLPFSKAAENTFFWNIYNYDETEGDVASAIPVKGETFSAENIKASSADKVSSYFRDNGYEAVFADPSSGEIQYQKENIGCILKKDSHVGSYTVTVSCGEIIQ